MSKTFALGAALPFLLIPGAVGSTISGEHPSSTAETVLAAAQDPAGEEIQRLISQLGSAQYARRERAYAELQRLGVDAFDALHDAQHDSDIEIALRSRHLLHHMDIRWAHAEDPVQVKEIMRGYGDQSASERKNLMEQLAKLPDGAGIAALCRLVRFDGANVLSKRAALLILRASPSAGAEAGQAFGELILRELGTSHRESAEWLRTYVQLHDDPLSLVEAWESICRREEQMLEKAPEKSSVEIVRDLLRWQIDLLDRLDRPGPAHAVVLRTIDLLDGTREQLLETVDWLMQRQAWSSVADIAQRFPQPFEEHALLLYRLAESHLKQGRLEDAEQTALRALAINADAAQDHILAAFTLQERGLFDWSEREYRHVLQLGPTGSQNDLRARFLLSEMLHDIARDLDAATALQPAVDAMAADQNVEYLVRRLGREPEAIRSRMYYFYAEHARQQGQTDLQVQHLREGIDQDPTDADVLIAMYRVADADPEWRNLTLGHIHRTVQQNRQQIRAAEQAAAAAPNEEIRSAYHRQVALFNNQLAWLVSNTQGDFDEALRCSLRSLELRPETAAYLDTLGRCYFALSDLEKAVEVQSRAVELEPFSGQIRRQLDYFRQALAASQATTETANSSP